MKRCIYCLAEKVEGAFNREHVLPQAYGTFEKSLVLTCVCEDCNSYFGRELDLKLARDTAEAIDRVAVGLKDASQFESLGKRSTTYVEIKDGPMKGAFAYHAPNPDGGRELRLLLLPQIWFSKSSEGPFEKFRADQLPTKEEVIDKGYDPPNLYMRMWGLDWDTGLDLLEKKGFPRSSFESKDPTPPPPPERVFAETVVRVSHPEFRAVTKIALNYVAAVVGSDVAMRSEFDDARGYVRYGTERARLKVHPFHNPHFLGRQGHYISLTKSKGLIVVELSLLMRTQYFVVLTEAGTDVPIKSTAHLFNLETKKLVEIEPLPIRPGRPLTPLP
jgi:hypothetical protein